MSKSTFSLGLLSVNNIDVGFNYRTLKYIQIRTSNSSNLNNNLNSQSSFNRPKMSKKYVETILLKAEFSKLHPKYFIAGKTKSVLAIYSITDILIYFNNFLNKVSFLMVLQQLKQFSSLVKHYIDN